VNGTEEGRKEGRKEGNGPVLACRTLEEDDAGLVGTFCESMCGAVPAVVSGAGKRQLEPWFSVTSFALLARATLQTGRWDSAGDGAQRR
jgi:hypothetical protein